MKKFICSTLSALMIFSSVNAFAIEFSDMKDPSVAWAAPTVNKLSDLGIIKGYDDGTYKPSRQITNQEAFTLFARTLGINAKAYRNEVKTAQQIYGDFANTYETYARREMCFMLYKGVVKESEINEYFAPNNKDVSMKRHEAAKLIYKIMGQPNEGSSVMFTFDYSDVDQFPIGSEKYIDYVTKNKIMTGMGDGTFSPNTSVTRAQIAIMLEKVMGILNLDYTPDDGKEDETVAPPTPSENQLSVAFNGAAVEDNVTFISVYDYNEGIASANRYELTTDVEVMKNGEKAALSDLQIADWITITLDEDKVTKIEAVNKSRTIDGVAFSKLISTADGMSIVLKSSNPEFDGFSIPVDENAFVLRNDESATVLDLRADDDLIITSSYGIATSIRATGTTAPAPETEKIVKGTISGFSVTTNEVYINLSSYEDKIYITDSSIITLDGEKIDPYSLRAGYNATVTIKNGSALTIDATTKKEETTLTGTVSLVNSNLNFVNIAVGENTYQMFITASTSVSTSEGVAELTISDIKTGDLVTVSYEEDLGAYTAKTVIIQK